MTLSERWFRSNPDSSVLDRPRLLARSLIRVADLDDHIGYYERLQGVTADLRMPIPDFGGLELAAVGGLLLIASAGPFTPIQRQTAYSLIVPSLIGRLASQQRLGATVLEPPEEIVPGSRARVRYPDGSIAELVEHRPQAGERPDPRPRFAADTGVRLLARRAVPRAGLDEAVAFYESVLETEAGTRVEPRPQAAELAIVGNLLLVGSDELSRAGSTPVGFALLTTPAGEGGTVACPENGRAVVALTTGALAEVWDGRPPAGPR
jgi:hypothetical protein